MQNCPLNCPEFPVTVPPGLRIVHFVPAGIPLYRFRPPPNVFAMDDPNNFCYCPEFHECAKRKVDKGSILQDSVLPEKFSDKFLASNCGQFSIKNQLIQIYLSRMDKNIKFRGILKSR
jgi:hypothetical protein